MTDAKTVTVIVLDSGGTNEFTIYPTRVEDVRNKVLDKITAPQDTETAGGPNDTLILDLLQVEKRYIVKGYCASADLAKLKNVFNDGGVVKFTYQGLPDEYINFEKLQIVEDIKRSGEQDETEIIFTAIVGVNLLGA